MNADQAKPVKSETLNVISSLRAWLFTFDFSRFTFDGLSVFSALISVLMSLTNQ
jgi:hypothetical protein